MEYRDSTLWSELKSRVERELERRGGERRASRTVYAKLGTLIGIIVLCYVAILCLPPSPGWYLLWATIGVATFFLLVNAAHDAAHGSLFRSRAVNRGFLLASFGMLGIDGELWGLRDKTAHHPHTNVSAVDPDSLPNSFLRLSPCHPWRPWFRWQHLYAVLLYPWALFHTACIQDFEHLIRKPLPYLLRIRSPRKAAARMVFIKVFYLAVFLAAPVALFGQPLGAVLTGIACQFGIASLVFVLTICLNHYVLETTFYENDGSHEGDHLLHQLRSSADWHATSPLYCALMGGANAHTAHHLFPALSHRHYHWVSEIVERFCEEKELPYHSFTFLRGLRSHFAFLAELGRRPPAA